jgi:hypothetical protein
MLFRFTIKITFFTELSRKILSILYFIFYISDLFHSLLREVNMSLCWVLLDALSTIYIK